METTVLKATAIEGTTLKATSRISDHTTTVPNKIALRLAKERPMVNNDISAFDNPDRLAATMAGSDTSLAERQMSAAPLKACGVSHDY
jgi:hypothetical protein